MRRVLVTGGAGFVGSNLVARLLASDIERVVVVDNLLSSEPDNLVPDRRLDVRVGSIADGAVLRGLGDEFDVVFHLATYHGNETSAARPLDDHANTLFPTLRLFEHLAGQRGPLRRVVYPSTGCALADRDVPSPRPVKEDGPVPLDYDSPYQISKVAGEMYAVYYHQRHGLPVVRVRFQNVYGPGEVLGAGRWRGAPATIWRNVVPSFIYRALRKQPLPVHDEGATRDFIHVDDIVDGLLLAATATGIEGDVFNLASGGETVILDIAHLVNELTGNVAGVQVVGARAWDRSLARVGDPAKAAARLGYRARTPLRSGLARTVAWTAENLDRIAACIRRHAAYCRVDF